MLFRPVENSRVLVGSAREKGPCCVLQNREPFASTVRPRRPPPLPWELRRGAPFLPPRDSMGVPQAPYWSPHSSPSPTSPSPSPAIIPLPYPPITPLPPPWAPLSSPYFPILPPPSITPLPLPRAPHPSPHFPSPGLLIPHPTSPALGS